MYVVFMFFGVAVVAAVVFLYSCVVLLPMCWFPLLSCSFDGFLVDFGAAEGNRVFVLCPVARVAY